jgi:hypothetical protein
MGPLRHLDLIAVGLHPGPCRSHRQDILLDRHLDEPGIHAGQVEMNRQLVAPTVGVDRDRAGSPFAEHLLGDPVEFAEWLESHQHDDVLSVTLECLEVGDRRASGMLKAAYPGL